MDKKEKIDWEDLCPKEMIKADSYWLSSLSTNKKPASHPILSLFAQNRPQNPEALHTLMVFAKNFISDKFDSFDLTLVDDSTRTRSPYLNEIAWLLSEIIAFAFALLHRDIIPKEECFQWAHHTNQVHQLIKRAEKHLMINITKTRFKEISKAYKKLASQAKLYFGASEWSQYVDEDLLPKTSSSSSVLVNEDLTVDPLESANFHDEESVRANQSNNSERNSASTIASYANETSFNSPNDPDTLTVREQASNRRTSPRAATTEVRSERSDKESEASQSDREESDETLLDIEYQEEEYERDECESQSSGSDYEPFD